MMLLIILWILIGLFGWCLDYCSLRKDWYIKFKEEYWKAKEHSGLDITVNLGIFISIIGGPIFFISVMLQYKFKNLSLRFKWYE